MRSFYEITYTTQWPRHNRINWYRVNGTTYHRIFNWMGLAYTLHIPNINWHWARKPEGLMAKRNKLERKLDEYNHTMELVRTIVPIIVLVLQIVILTKLV